MSLTPKETKRKQQLMQRAQQQGWLLLPDDSAELQALYAKAGKTLIVERVELAALGNDGISYTDILKHDAKGEVAKKKEKAARVGFSKDKGRNKQDSDTQETHENE